MEQTEQNIHPLVLHFSACFNIYFNVPMFLASCVGAMLN